MNHTNRIKGINQPSSNLEQIWLHLDLVYMWTSLNIYASILFWSLFHPICRWQRSFSRWSFQQILLVYPQNSGVEWFNLKTADVQCSNSRFNHQVVFFAFKVGSGLGKLVMIASSIVPYAPCWGIECLGFWRAGETSMCPMWFLIQRFAKQHVE